MCLLLHASIKHINKEDRANTRYLKSNKYGKKHRFSFDLEEIYESIIRMRRKDFAYHTHSSDTTSCTEAHRK